ncbi:MAG: hypothetical protein U0694_07200 [Anaerolineae bacterium]
MIYEGVYVAIIARDRLYFPHTRFMMFRILPDGTVVYIPDPIVATHNYIMSFNSYAYVYNTGSYDDYLGGFMDRNGNGFLISP